jgi:magnesium transporter
MPATILTHGRVTWTNLTNPTQAEIQELSARYPQFHPLNLQDCLTELEFPKLDHHDDYLFLVVQIPYWNESNQLFLPAEVDIFVARGILVTAHHDNLPPLRELFASAESDPSERARLMERGASPLLYHLLDVLMNASYPYVHDQNHRLRQIEARLFQENTNSVLQEIASLRRSLIALRRILDPQVGTIHQLEVGSWPFIHEDLDIYWGDLGDHLSQLCAMLDENSEVISGLSETIDTLASHRIDEVVRLLTIVTVLTLPLTLLATLFGMNIALPYSEHPLLFFAILGLGLIAILTLVWYLRKRRWL